jgi:hypothetical protein
MALSIWMRGESGYRSSAMIRSSAASLRGGFFVGQVKVH